MVKKEMQCKLEEIKMSVKKKNLYKEIDDEETSSYC